MGHRAWGIGHRAWGMEKGERRKEENPVRGGGRDVACNVWLLCNSIDIASLESRIMLKSFFFKFVQFE